MALIQIDSVGLLRVYLLLGREAVQLYLTLVTKLINKFIVRIFYK